MLSWKNDPLWRRHYSKSKNRDYRFHQTTQESVWIDSPPSSPLHSPSIASTRTSPSIALTRTSPSIALPIVAPTRLGGAPVLMLSFNSQDPPPSSLESTPPADWVLKFEKDKSFESFEIFDELVQQMITKEAIKLGRSMTNRHGELKSGKRYCQHKHCEFKLRFSVQTNGSVKITSSTLSHNHARHQPTVFNGKTLKTLESEVTEWEAAFFKDHGPYSPSALLRKTLDEKFPTVVFSQNLFHRLKKKACEERFGKTGAGDIQN